jgi:RsmE family RNA methyltransferase
VNLILLEPGEIGDGGVVRLRDARARHVSSVLNVARGQQVRVGVVDGPRGLGDVESAAGDDVVLRCVFEAAAPPRPAVDLLLALPRPKVLQRLWAQIAALGVGRIVLTNAEKVERHYFDTHILSPDGYRPLLLEGLQQARDTRVPDVSIHRRFRPLIEDELDDLIGDATRIVAEPAGARAIADVVASRPPARMLLAVGPEGGWNRFELEMLGAHGFTSISMGPRTLRSDTACIALLALAHDAMRSLQ